MIIKGKGLFTVAYLFICMLYTKIFFRKAKIIRIPFWLNNMGSFKFGKNLNIGKSLRVDIFKGANLTIGEEFEINDFCHIACNKKIEIGNDVLIASKVFITDHDHLISEFREAPKRTGLDSKEVKIGNRVWIGENVSILKGVKIGSDCVVAANSVVTKSFEDGAIIGGTPAKLIRKRKFLS